jgi:hypothetical protein
MCEKSSESLSVDVASTLKIEYEWELHTCKRGHTWRFPKQSEMVRCDPFHFIWTDVNGVLCSAGSGAICLQCYRDDLVSSYGPVKTVPVT